MNKKKFLILPILIITLFVSCDQPIKTPAWFDAYPAKKALLTAVYAKSNKAFPTTIDSRTIILGGDCTLSPPSQAGDPYTFMTTFTTTDKVHFNNSEFDNFRAAVVSSGFVKNETTGTYEKGTEEIDIYIIMNDDVDPHFEYFYTFYGGLVY